MLFLTGKITMDMAVQFTIDMDRLSNRNTILVNVNTEGGEAYAMDLIITTINQVKQRGVHVVMNCSGLVASAGVPIVLSGSEVIVNGALFMVHKVITDHFGSANELKNSLHINQHFDNKVFNIIEGLLTESGMQKFINGEDVYITPNEQMINKLISDREGFNEN